MKLPAALSLTVLAASAQVLALDDGGAERVRLYRLRKG